MFIINDLGLAAYFIINGLVLKDARVNDRGVFVFEFDDPNKEAKKLSINFLNSECSRFDQQVRNLRTLLKTSGN